MTSPDFFIAGAAKCGTTALFDYLCRHPQVYMAPNKEPKYFCTDLKTAGGVYSLEDYRALFSPAPDNCATGEASTLYLYSAVAIERVIAYNPNAKIIVMLRYPVDAAHSLHAARWSRKIENIENFEEAWRAQPARLSKLRMPAGWPDPATLQYGAMYRYAEQVRRVLKHVPKGQRHIIIYEEFFADPRHHYAALLEFLQLAPDLRTAFPVVNSARGPGSRRLERWLRKPPRWLEAAYAPVRPFLQRAGISPGRTLWELNSVSRPNVALRPAFRAELDGFFAADIAELEGLLGRALWRQIRALE
jgi:sulfotransferase family protein